MLNSPLLDQDTRKSQDKTLNEKNIRIYESNGLKRWNERTESEKEGKLTFLHIYLETYNSKCGRL